MGRKRSSQEWNRWVAFPSKLIAGLPEKRAELQPWLERTLRGLQEAVDRGDAEEAAYLTASLIVVENKASDNTTELLTKFLVKDAHRKAGLRAARTEQVEKRRQLVRQLHAEEYAKGNRRGKLVCAIRSRLKTKALTDDQLEDIGERTVRRGLKALGLLLV